MSGISFAQASRSLLPRIASTGAINLSDVRISGLPISPTWMISSEPFNAAMASGRSRPCVSDIKPIRPDVNFSRFS